MIVEVRIMFRGTVKGGAHRDRGGRRQVEAAGQAEQRMDNPQTCGLGVVNVQYECCLYDGLDGVGCA